MDLDGFARRAPAVVAEAQLSAPSGSSQARPALQEPVKEQRGRGRVEPRGETPFVLPATVTHAAQGDSESGRPWWQKALGRF